MNFPGKGGVRALTQGLVTHRHEIFYNFPSLPTLLCALSDHLRGPSSKHLPFLHRADIYSSPIMHQVLS